MRLTELAGVNKMQMATLAHLPKGLFKYWLLARIFLAGLKPSFMDPSLTLSCPPPSPPPRSPLFMDSGTPDILMVSAMPPMAATFIFMASSCPRHLFGHLGKTSPAQAAALPPPQPGPSSFYGRRKRPMRACLWDLCSQSGPSADLGPGGSEGWDGMLKCLNCGMHRGGRRGRGWRSSDPSPPKPIYLGLMDLKATRTS